MIYKKEILFLILYILKITTYFFAATFFVFIEVILMIQCKSVTLMAVRYMLEIEIITLMQMIMR